MRHHSLGVTPGTSTRGLFQPEPKEFKGAVFLFFKSSSYHELMVFCIQEQILDSLQPAESLGSKWFSCL